LSIFQKKLSLGGRENALGKVTVLYEGRGEGGHHIREIAIALLFIEWGSSLFRGVDSFGKNWD